MALQNRTQETGLQRVYAYPTTRLHEFDLPHCTG